MNKPLSIQRLLRLVVMTCTVVYFSVVSFGLLNTAEAKGKPTVSSCDNFEPVLVFHNTISAIDKDIVVANAQGTCQFKVADGVEVKYVTPNWFPDGSGIVFYGNLPQAGLYYLSREEIELGIETHTLPLTPNLIVTVNDDYGFSYPDVRPKFEELENGDRLYEIVYGNNGPNAEGLGIYIVQVLIDSAGVPHIEGGPYWLPTGEPSSVSADNTSWLNEDELITEYCCDGPEGDYYIFRLSRDSQSATPMALTDKRRLFEGCEDYLSELTYSSWQMKPSHDGMKLAVTSFANNDVYLIDVMNPCGDGPTNITNNVLLEQAHPTWTPDDNRITYRQRSTKRTCDVRGVQPYSIHTREVDEDEPCEGNKLFELSDGGVTRVYWRPLEQ